MMNCNEMVNRLLERKDQYVAEQKRKRKTAVRITTYAFSFALVILLGVGVWQSNLFDRTTVTDVDNSSNISEQDYSDKLNTETNDNLAKSNKINIVKIDGISAAKYNTDLLEEDFIPLTNDELKSYYGINIFPTVPRDLGTEWGEEDGSSRGIYKKNNGTGKVYYDVQILNYSNEDFSRSVNIELCKGHMPMSDYGSLDWSDSEMSVINNTNVGIGQTDAGHYLVEFVYKNVGFRLIVEGLTQEEMVSVVASIIK